MPTMPQTRLIELYEDLHRNPELSFNEHLTAGVVSAVLRDLGFVVEEGQGGTGVVGILGRGTGPVVWLRADMDALPVVEATGVTYTSEVDGVAHACGHDVHVACLLGAATELAYRKDWGGTVVLIFQPAEELVKGAQAMVDSGIISRLPNPQVVLAQHVAPLPAGVLGYTPGPMWAATDSLTITIFGSGGHGSRPETTIDPVVIAAATILRLQTIVSREVATTETAVLTVGAVNAGSKHNIIPETATLLVNIRTYDPDVRKRVLASVNRIVFAESQAAGASRAPEVQLVESSPTLVNDLDAGRQTLPALHSVVGAANVIDPGPLPSSEDVQVLSAAAGAPLVFWLLGGAAPEHFSDLSSVKSVMEIVRTLPSNHSPQYCPVEIPTLAIGVDALVAAALIWLDPNTEGDHYV